MMMVVVVVEEWDEMDQKRWETDTDSQEGRSDSHGTVDQGHNRVVTNLLDVTLTGHDRFNQNINGVDRLMRTLVSSDNWVESVEMERRLETTERRRVLRNGYRLKQRTTFETIDRRTIER